MDLNLYELKLKFISLHAFQNCFKIICYCVIPIVSLVVYFILIKDKNSFIIYKKM